MDVATIIAAGIAAGPASVAAIAAMKNGYNMRTNHGKNIGQHVEGLVDGQARMEAWAVLHQESDNDLREALGLDRVELPFPKRDDDVDSET